MGYPVQSYAPKSYAPVKKSYNVNIPKPVNTNTYQNQTQNYADTQYTNRYLNIDYNIQRTNLVKDIVTVTPRMNVNTVYAGMTYNQKPLSISYSGYAPPPPQICLKPNYTCPPSYGGGYQQPNYSGGYQSSLQNNYGNVSYM